VILHEAFLSVEFHRVSNRASRLTADGTDPNAG
jgi:hypothetical protein